MTGDRVTTVLRPYLAGDVTPGAGAALLRCGAANALEALAAAGALHGAWVQWEAPGMFGARGGYLRHADDDGETWWRIRRDERYVKEWILGAPGTRVVALWTDRSKGYKTAQDLINHAAPWVTALVLPAEPDPRKL